ncbi:MAG: gliding motility-associated C-terminal domain-containing protein [Chitinophagales bacterium]|nr:gliding motility-associated C-terminal domain-containing protein [Chitinophagales bacterium]
MKKLYSFGILLLSLLTANSQCVTNVNFNTWTQGGNPGNGNWVPQLGGTQVRQTVNGAPTFFLSPFDLMNVHVTGNFRTTDDDDDWMGFVFSYLNPMGAIDTFDCWLFDWKQQQQGGASSGKSLCRVDGVIPPGMYNTTFWNHQNTPEFTVIQNSFGTAGWNQGFNHSFELFLTYTTVTIVVDGVQTFQWTDCFKPGRFGFYNYSQKDCYYSNFQYDLYVDFDFTPQMCTGTSASFEFVNPCINANLSQYQSLQWNFGDGTIVTVNNPTFLTANKTHSYSSPGTYNVTLTLTDNNGCTATKTHQVTVAGPIVLNAAVNPPPCNGGSNGGITLAPTNGFGNYQYQWSNGTTQNTFVGASAGTYSVTVTDVACTTTQQFTINQPPPLTATTSHTDAPCGGNGTATITISGGTPPYSGVNWAGFPGYTVSLPAGTWIADFHDANGCSALLQYTETITQLPCGITTNVTTTNVSCFGGANGTATLTVTGSTPPVNITWSNGSTGATATGLTAGTHTYTYTDANPSHNFSGTVTITQPGAAMVATLNTIGIACAGLNTGEAFASVPSGGAPPYNYLWSGGYPNSPHITNLPPGSISVTVTDASGCTATAAGNISGVPSLSVTVATTPDSCFHSGKGDAVATVSGGTLPYSYSWNNFKTTNVNPSLIAGTYTVTVTDGSGCTVTGSGTVSGPPVLTTSFTLQHIACYGDNNGSFNVSAAGGTPPYTYIWNPSTVSGTNPTGLAAGIYAYTVADANGCTVLRQDTILEPDAPLTATSSHTNVTCHGANNGSITVTVSGGVTPYTFMGNPVPAGTTVIPNLSPNTYSGTLVDSNGCSVSLSETITEPGPQSLTVAATDNPCAGAQQGTVTANFVNPTGSVTYTWNPGGVQPASLNNLPSGVYDVTASDANNCSFTGSATINEPPAPSMTVSTTDATCFGGNGSATANPTGGNLPYNYAWSNNAGGNSATVTPPAGSYTVSASDADGCNQTAAFTINEPAQLNISETHTNNLCFGMSTATATVTITGGTPGYTYQWSPNVSSTNNASNLPAGNYSVTGTDANNCTAVQSITITEPPQIDVSATSVNVLCNGGNTGSVTAVGSGGTSPYTYSLTIGGSNIQTSSTGQFANQTAATYTVYVTDNNQCSDSTVVTITEPALLAGQISTVDVTCFGENNGQLTVSVNGGTPNYSYQFSQSTQNTSGTLANLSAGNYSVTITDANGCTTLQSATITEPAALVVTVLPTVAEVKSGETLNLQATINQSGSVSYTWQPTGGLSCADCDAPVFSGSFSTVYYVTATTQAGCAATASVSVTVIPNYDIFIPNVFTPNGDFMNDTWSMFGNLKDIKQFNVKVFNRWGEKVFESNDINFAWDGKYLGQTAPNGVYTYVAGFVWMDNHSDNNYKGTVTLLR